MSLTFTDDVLQAAGMSEDELSREVAILLFQQERLTLGQAARLAGVDLLSFQQMLGSRQIGPHYGEAEFGEDLRTIRGGTGH